MYLYVCACDLSGNENAPRCDLHKTCTVCDTNCSTARHLSFISPPIFVMFLFFFPVILVYRLYIQVYNNVAGFGWVGDFILLTRLHTVCIISAECIRVNWYTYIIYLLHVYYIYYTILLFLLGRIDIDIYCNYHSRSHTLRRIMYHIFIIML